ncbi:MAG TPA: PspC domain-containing protein [Gaiellaceae bacterium]|nr:PspC domain-containing protein [Gaiellaceae bacterium]
MTTARSGRLSFGISGVARSEDGRALGGVASGLGSALGVDPTLVRLVFALLALASGAGIAAYAGAWLLLPIEGAPQPSRRRKAFGIGALVVAAALGLRGLGLADSLVWPVVLIAAGIWQLRGVRQGRPPLVGVILVALGVVLCVRQYGEQTGVGPVLAPGAVVAALLAVCGPWLWRLVHERDAERAERIRTEERAELASRVHDSVLQTLALIQKEGDPRRVAILARRQERELRGWLYPDASRVEGAESLSAALEAAADEIEQLHGIRVELVRTGDAALDEPLRALVLAAREAMGNAAKHAGVEEVAVFADVEDGGVSVFVRDRGAGFDPAAVPGDRRGIAESIRARMERAGGEAVVRAAPGEGTEIELRLGKTRV